jgi:hypothetical protein
MNDFPLQAGREVLIPLLDDQDPSKRLIAAKCLGLLAGYDARWRNAPYKIDSVETVLTSDLYNPETQRKSRTFTVAGKLDVRMTDIATGEKVVPDHKTASQDITDPNAPYWRQLVVEGQVTHYLLLEWLNGNKVDYALWDVMRKPDIRPKALSKADAKVTLETKTYCEYSLTEFDLDSLAKDGRETDMMYSARLAYDCSTERPQHYFQRRKVPRLDSEIREYGIELWGHGQDIIAARANNRWPRNSGACFVYNSPCTYLGLCSKFDTLDSGYWTKTEWVHPELPVLNNGRGTDVLTNSRIRCFQTCRQKHYLKYELGVQKLDEEEREALYFGSLWHSASEAYFLEMKKQQEK